MDKYAFYLIDERHLRNIVLVYRKTTHVVVVIVVLKLYGRELQWTIYKSAPNNSHIGII